MAIEIINGTSIVVKFVEYDETPGNPVQVFCSTSCTLNINGETVAASCKDGGNWAQNVEGNKSWDISVDGLYQIDTANGFADMADLFTDDTKKNDVDILVGQDDTPTVAGDPTTPIGGLYWKGRAVLTSCSLSAPDGEIATWTATFAGNGALVKEVIPTP